jgi:catalase
VNNIGHNLAQCIKPIQDAIISYCTQADADYGRRVTEMMHKRVAAMKAMPKEQPMAMAPEMATQGK